jgi:hypothetical protein
MVPVRIRTTNEHSTVYTIHPRAKIVDPEDYNEDDYISFKEIRGE